MVLVHEGLNSRVELSEDPQLGITVQMYIGCADGHPDLVARQCPACGTDYSADNPPSADYNVCSYCAEDIEICKKHMKASTRLIKSQTRKSLL